MPRNGFCDTNLVDEQEGGIDKLSEPNRQDALKLLKRFGIKADESIVEHLKKEPRCAELRVRLTLEDYTEYEDETRRMSPMTVEGTVRSGS